MEMKKYLENSQLCRMSSVRGGCRNNIAVSIPGELELPCNFMIEFNHLYNITIRGKLLELFLTALMNGLSLPYL